MEILKVSKENKTSIKDQAKAELVEEKTQEFRDKLKGKLKEEQAAKVVLANIKREIDFLEKKIEQEINDING